MNPRGDLSPTTKTRASVFASASSQREWMMDDHSDAAADHLWPAHKSLGKSSLSIDDEEKQKATRRRVRIATPSPPPSLFGLARILYMERTAGAKPSPHPPTNQAYSHLKLTPARQRRILLFLAFAQNKCILPSLPSTSRQQRVC